MIGTITGLVFYWALAFGILPYIPKEIVANVASLFVLSVLGGWAGPRVFDLIFKKFV